VPTKVEDFYCNCYIKCPKFTVAYTVAVLKRSLCDADAEQTGWLLRTGARVLCRSRLARTGRQSTSAELDEDVACQLDVVLGEVQSLGDADLVEALVDQLLHVWVGHGHGRRRV